MNALDSWLDVHGFDRSGGWLFLAHTVALVGVILWLVYSGIAS